MDRCDLHATDALIDVRPEDRFTSGHLPGAVNVPLEELDRRVHELPFRDTPLVVYDEVRERAERAEVYLTRCERGPVRALWGSQCLEQTALETGPSTRRLWRPHALLEEAMRFCRSAWGDLSDKRAVDLACGTGRDAVYLALLGFKVEAVDVLPDALERAADLARRNGVAVTTRQADLERESEPLSAETYDLVTVFHFLHRPLFSMIRDAVRPGGFVVYETFLKEQRRRFGKPRRDAHLLHPGELRSYFDGWTLHVSREGLSGPRRVTAALIARKPADPGSD
jgi:tellurite methyltransferase